MENLFFSISELIYSDTANKYKINNTPTNEHIDNLHKLIHYVLQPIRIHYGVPVYITGGYRSKALWQKLKDLGRNPATNSQHLTGQAADFVVRGKNCKDVFNWIKKSNIEYDQMLYEYDSSGNIWIHISYNHRHNRKQAIDNYKGC